MLRFAVMLALLSMIRPRFMGLTFAGTLGMGILFIFIASAPVVFSGQYGLSPTGFSLAFAINAIGCFSASQAAGPLAERLGVSRVVVFGTAMFCAFTALAAAATFAGPVSLPILVAGLFLGNAGLAPTTFRPTPGTV